MDIDASSAKKKGKAKVDWSRGRRTWQKFEEDFAIATMRALVLDPKWKLDTGAFRSGFFVEVEKKFVQTFAGIDLRASPHIESKVRVWKRHYHTLSDMLKTSGFGWDDKKKMILVDSEDVWNNYVVRKPEVAHMRYKSWPYYDDWLVLFGRDRATGDLAEDAAEMVETMTLEQMSVNLDEDLDGGFNNPTSMDVQDGSTDNTAPAVFGCFGTSKGGKKRARVNDVATKCLTDMVATFSKAFEETNSSLAKIAESFCHQNYKDTKMEDLQKNLNDELAQFSFNLKQRMKALRLLIKDEGLVRLFYSMEHITERTELIEGLLEEA